VDVEFETAATVEFEALAFPALAAFAFFPVALVLAATAVAVSLARRGKQISCLVLCGTYQQPYSSLVNERKLLRLVHISHSPLLSAKCSPIARGPRASRPSSVVGRARPETTEAEMARSARIDPKFFMVIG
jgi:hypothetical protein